MVYDQNLYLVLYILPLADALYLGRMLWLWLTMILSDDMFHGENDGLCMILMSRRFLFWSREYALSQLAYGLTMTSIKGLPSYQAKIQSIPSTCAWG